MPNNLTQEKFFNIFIESFLVLLVLFLPLVYGSVTNLPLFLIETTSFLILLLVIIKQTFEGRIAIIKTPVILLFLFVLLVLFQLIRFPEQFLTLISPNTSKLYGQFGVDGNQYMSVSICRNLTLHYFLQFLSCLAAFFAILCYIDSPDKLKRLAGIIIISGFLYSIYGILKRNPLVLESEFSTFTNYNHFAAYLEMIVFVTIGFSFVDFSKTIKLLTIFFASVMTIAIFLSASRAGRISFGISFFFFFLILWFRRPPKKTAITISLLVLFIFIFITLIGPGELLKRMETLANPLMAYQWRLDLLRDSFRIIQDFPYLGVGFGAFSELIQKYKTSHWQGSYVFSHNEPVQLLAEVGIIGFFPLLLFFLIFMKRIFVMWRERNSNFSIFLTAGLLTGILSVLMHSFFDFIFHVPANAILFSIILALTYRTVYMKEHNSLHLVPKSEFTVSNFMKVPLTFLFCFVFIFFGVVVAKRYKAEAMFAAVKGEKVHDTGLDGFLKSVKLLKQLDKITVLNGENGQYFNKKGDILSDLASKEDLREEINNSGIFKNTGHVLELSEESYKRAINLNVTKADYHVRLGWLYGVTDRIKLKDLELRKALSLDPANRDLKKYVEKNLSQEKKDANNE